MWQFTDAGLRTAKTLCTVRAWSLLACQQQDPFPAYTTVTAEAMGLCARVGPSTG